MPEGDVELVVEYYADDEPIDPDAEEVVLIDNGDGTWTITSMPACDVELEVEYDDGSTAIISIRGGKVDDVTIYDLNGRRLPEKPARGFYIQGGKKYFAEQLTLKIERKAPVRVPFFINGKFGNKVFSPSVSIVFP